MDKPSTGKASYGLDVAEKDPESAKNGTVIDWLIDMERKKVVSESNA